METIRHAQCGHALDFSWPTIIVVRDKNRVKCYEGKQCWKKALENMIKGNM